MLKKHIKFQGIQKPQKRTKWGAVDFVSTDTNWYTSGSSYHYTDTPYVTEQVKLTQDELNAINTSPMNVKSLNVKWAADPPELVFNSQGGWTNPQEMWLDARVEEICRLGRV